MQTEMNNAIDVITFHQRRHGDYIFRMVICNAPQNAKLPFIRLFRCNQIAHLHIDLLFPFRADKIHLTGLQLPYLIYNFIVYGQQKLKFL